MDEIDHAKNTVSFKMHQKKLKLETIEYFRLKK